MKHARDIRFGATLGNNVSVCVGVDLAFEHGSIRNVADRHEKAIHVLLPDRAGLQVFQADAGYQMLRRIVNLFDYRAGEELDFGIMPRAIQHDFGGAKLIAAMHYGDLGAEARQEVGLFHLGVAAADHHDLLATIEKAVAGGAGTDSVPDQLLFGFKPQPARRSTGSDDQGARLNPLALDIDAERVARQLRIDNIAMHKFRAEILRLFSDVFDQFRTVDAFREAGKVLDQRSHGQLPAGIVPQHHERLQIGAGRVDRCRVAGATGTDNDDVSHLEFRFYNVSRRCAIWLAPDILIIRRMPAKPVLYQDAGVNIDEADRAVSAIRKLARATFTRGVLTDIGSFGACYSLAGWKKPVLISSADGVGTKIKIAFLTGRHDTVGEDLVNHCTNDIAVQGAVPLFFLDYFAVGKLEAAVAGQVVAGLARGCRQNGCALIGGETAEMPGLYAPGEYDLAGFIVGAAERSSLLTGKQIRAGDVLLGLPSTGLHTNGYSLARKLLFEVAGYGPASRIPELGETVADTLLRVHRSYLKPIRALAAKSLLRGAAHVTGGGLTDNTPRMLPEGLAAEIDTCAWTIPPIFELLRQLGNVPAADYRRTFNLGIGMVLAVAGAHSTHAAQILRKLGEPFFTIGTVVRRKRGGPRVVYR